MPVTGLNPPYALELVNYQLNDGVDQESFIAINRQVGSEFTSIQPGFLHREIGKDENGKWLIAVFWKTSQDARNSIANIDDIPDTVKQYMSMIDRKTIVRSIFDIV